MKIPAQWTERDLIVTPPSSSTSTTATKPKKNKPQQCLRFSPTIEVAEIPNRSDYSREEIEDCWFQGYDYDEFRENSYMTMGLYRAGLLPCANEKHCMRGLEGRLQEASKEREWTRYHATAAVLNEQYRQVRTHYTQRNVQTIADLYHAVSWKSQYKAYTQAMLDEQEQREATTTSLMNSLPKAKSSPRRNLLRRVIDIDNSMDNSSSCSMQSFSSATSSPAIDFDISSFLQELTIVPAQ